MTSSSKAETRDNPPCGIYRTTRQIGDDVPAGILVFYHNHGDPGPGVYKVRQWKNNKAVFHEEGNTVPDEQYARSLEPLPPEGLYRVAESFYCCEKKCQLYEEEMLVQLGYNGDAEALLFLPEMVEGALVLPDEGKFVEEWQLNALAPLKVVESDPPDPMLN